MKLTIVSPWANRKPRIIRGRRCATGTSGARTGDMTLRRMSSALWSTIPPIVSQMIQR